MKKSIILLIFLWFGVSSYASNPGFGISYSTKSILNNDGLTSITYMTDVIDFGFGYSNMSSDFSLESSTRTVSFFIQLKTKIKEVEDFYVTYGLVSEAMRGDIFGVEIIDYNAFGFYIGFKKMIFPNLHFTAEYFPYTNTLFELDGLAPVETGRINALNRMGIVYDF